MSRRAWKMKGNAPQGPKIGGIVHRGPKKQGFLRVPGRLKCRESVFYPCSFFWFGQAVFFFSVFFFLRPQNKKRFSFTALLSTFAVEGGGGYNPSAHHFRTGCRFYSVWWWRSYGTRQAVTKANQPRHNQLAAKGRGAWRLADRYIGLHLCNCLQSISRIPMILWGRIESGFLKDSRPGTADSFRKACQAEHFYQKSTKSTKWKGQKTYFCHSDELLAFGYRFFHSLRRSCTKKHNYVKGYRAKNSAGNEKICKRILYLSLSPPLDCARAEL